MQKIRKKKSLARNDWNPYHKKVTKLKKIKERGKNIKNLLK